jgi:hypothetical protein
MLMITISTSTTNVNHIQKGADNFNSEFFEEYDSAFYDTLRPELDGLIKNPQEETIAKILAYSRLK